MGNDLFKHSSLFIAYFVVFLLMFSTFLVKAWNWGLKIDPEIVKSAFLTGLKTANMAVSFFLAATFVHENQQEWMFITGIIALFSIFIVYEGIGNTFKLLHGRLKATSK